MTDDASLPPEAVGKLVAQHREFLGFLERRVGDRAEAEDLLQEAFVRGLAHAGDLRDEGSIVAWFYRTLRNAVIDRHRRKGASQRALEALAREMADDVEPPREVRDVACGCVQRLSTTLKPEYAEALQRIEVEGVSVKDFAAQQGISANNAAARVHRARAALRKRVMQSCGTCAEHGCVDCTCADGQHGHC
ncbi:MAG: sigma-70 family RNA polymerase sigma factor [Deltaproteobacteria bacterium]|nr:sigma-70 family RNA polymerase sigma factor [Deltaproteobacteria bacterium]